MARSRFERAISVGGELKTPGTFFSGHFVYCVLFVLFMPRPKRQCAGGIAYHVLNRANGRLRMFRKADDFEAFERVLAEGVDRVGMRRED